MISAPLRLTKPTPQTAALGAGFLTSLFAFAVLAEDVREKQPFAVDQPVMLWLHTNTTAFWAHLSEFLNVFGGPTVMMPLLLTIPLVLWFTRRHPQALFAALALWGAAGTQWVLKRVFERARPHLWPSLVAEHGPSFPSGHSTVAAALWLVACVLLWRTPYRWAAVMLGAVYTAVMALSRVVLGVHYPTDVVAGVLTALVMVLGVFMLLRSRLTGERP